MATSTSTPDYFSGKPTPRRPAASVLGAHADAPPASPSTPRTPFLGRSISSPFGTPGSFRVEQEEYVVYEWGARHLSAGFAGESRPRCVAAFHPDDGRRMGDYRQFQGEHGRTPPKKDDQRWGDDDEWYSADIRSLDLGLVEDKLERALRNIHIDHLQLDQKPRKVLLAIPSLLPTPLLEIALKLLFSHVAQPPSVTILTSPLLSCVGAGVRNALVIDIGWEETVVTAVGEYKEVFQRRSVRAGKMLTRQVATMLDEEARLGAHVGRLRVDLQMAEEVTKRIAWCRQRHSDDSETAAKVVNVSLLQDASPTSIRIPIPFDRLADPAATTFFPLSSPPDRPDDHDLALPFLAYRVLLNLPSDLRAVCMARIIVTGGVSQLPGLKTRLLEEIRHLVETRGWDPVHNYGSATSAHRSRILQERNANTLQQRPPDEAADDMTSVPLSSTKKQQQQQQPVQQDSIPHSQRVHDDLQDPITLKAEREAAKGQANVVKGVVRGVHTLGAWAGVSLVASLRVRGVHEVEREEFLKHGLRESGAVF